MARADRRRAAREARHARPAAQRRGGSGSRVVEDSLFFTRLRRSTKPVFILLTVVFALSFVFLGVGSGSGGIGDLLNGNLSSFFGGGKSGPSIASAQKKLAKNPKDAAAHLQLAIAYRTKGQRDAAIAAYTSYVALKPKDSSALRDLVSLQIQKADDLRTRAQTAQLAQQNATAGQLFTPPATTKIGRAIGTDPITQLVSGQVGSGASVALSDMQSAYQRALASYRLLLAAQPGDASNYFDYAQAALSANDLGTAIGAYRRFLKLAPDDPLAPDVKQRIKQLEAYQASPQPTPVPSGR